MANPLIIGIGNKCRQGKDETGRMLVALFSLVGLRVTRYGFADALYEVCRRDHGMTEKDAPLLQRVGVEYREKDPLYWVKQVEAAIDHENPEIAIITDVRFENEAEWVRGRGGVLVRITRFLPGSDTPYIDPSRPADHPSEVELDPYPFDIEVTNDGGFVDLWGSAMTVGGYVIAQLESTPTQVDLAPIEVVSSPAHE